MDTRKQKGALCASKDTNSKLCLNSVLTKLGQSIMVVTPKDICGGF